MKSFIVSLVILSFFLVSCTTLSSTVTPNSVSTEVTIQSNNFYFLWGLVNTNRYLSNEIEDVYNDGKYGEIVKVEVSHSPLSYLTLGIVGFTRTRITIE